MRITMNFQGFVTAEISSVTDNDTGEPVDISKMTPSEVREKLLDGSFSVSLAEALDKATGDNDSIEIFDFEVE